MQNITLGINNVETPEFGVKAGQVWTDSDGTEYTVASVRTDKSDNSHAARRYGQKTVRAYAVNPQYKPNGHLVLGGVKTPVHWADETREGKFVEEFTQVR